MWRADVETPGAIWPVSRLFRLSEVQKPEKDQRAGLDAALVDAFIDYLRIERNASPLTLRNYSADLAAFANWFEEKLKRPCDWLTLDQFQIRGYLVHLNERKLSRAPIHLKMS